MCLEDEEAKLKMGDAKREANVKVNPDEEVTEVASLRWKTSGT